MKTKLGEIVTIKTGIYAKPHSSGKVIYLQAKHFDETGKYLKKALPDLPMNKQTEKHLLGYGDILFSAKGNKNFACLYNSDKGYSVASSTFLILQVEGDYKVKILPEYLVWFINQPEAQKWLKGKARGMSMPSISIQELKDLLISIPPIKKQEQIIAIDFLIKKEQQILKRISQLKEQYIQYSLLKSIEK